MQYLECLSAALQDMSHTYQPAERMFLVLQVVLAELRGIPGEIANNFHRPKGVVVPARRGSTSVEDMDPPMFTKRRQVARAYSKSKLPSIRRESMSSSMDLNIDPALASLSHRKTSDVDGERPDGFIIVTPSSDVSSWQTVAGDSLPTPGTLPPSITQRNNNAWMGADLDAHDIGHLATVHFPELRDMHQLPNEEGNGGSSGNPENPNVHLDFMSLGGDDWKDWQPNHGSLGTDLDGFPPNGFGGHFNPSTPGKFDSAISVGFGGEGV
jgi:hypothetical protein